jgi:hypothetical protein
MSDQVIAYFDDHPHINEIDFKNSYHLAYLRALFRMYDKIELISILDKLFDPKNNKSKIDQFLQVLYLELGVYCEGRRRDINLLCLGAVHLDTPESIPRLQLMLQSWNRQIYKVPLILSISWDKPFDVTNLVYEISKYENLTIELHPTPLTLFEHYAFLVTKYHATYPNYHIIFTRGSDVWTDKRTISYMLSVCFCEAIEMKFDFIIYPYVLYGADTQPSDSSITQTNVAPKLLSGYDEYTSYCMKMEILKKFIDKADPKLLQNKFCGKYLIKFLIHSANWFGFKLPLIGSSYYIKEEKPLTLDVADLVSVYHSLTDTKSIDFLANQFKTHKLTVEERNDLTIKFLQTINSMDYLRDSPGLT